MQTNGRLAQSWLERLLDMQEATRSSRVPPILRVHFGFLILDSRIISKIEKLPLRKISKIRNLKQRSAR